ncbi:MAG: hypothetical protein ACO1TE_29180 [Prosthecobacter sp.]
MSARTPRQKEAMERLRGDPPKPADRLGLMREADASWQKLARAVGDALQWPNRTVAAKISELQAIFNTIQRGENCNGWVNPYPADDPRSLMKQYQFVSFHDAHRFIMDIWSRQTGKDFTMALRAGVDAYSSRCEWTIAAPSERQSLESLEKCKTVVEALGDVIADFQEERESEQALIKSAKIVLPNGSIIRAVPGMPHTVRGLTSNVGITEADFLEKPKETMRALLGSIANEEAGEKSVRLITTPNGKNGYTYGIWNDAESIYSKRLITIWHAVCMGIKQNPYLLEKALKDPEGWAQEFLCEWLEGSSILLSYELIQSCESLEASKFDTPEALRLHPLRKIGGIDFGRIKDPTVANFALRGLGKSVVRNKTILRGMSTPDQIDVLLPYMSLCDIVAVDYTGPGIGFGDMAVKALGLYDPANGQFGRIMLCTFTPNFKRIIFPHLRSVFERRDILIPIDVDQREDLHQMQIITTGGQFSYKAPHTDEGHSDDCTSLALLEHAGRQTNGGPFAFESTPRGSGGSGQGGMPGLGSPHEGRTPMM